MNGEPPRGWAPESKAGDSVGGEAVWGGPQYTHKGRRAVRRGRRRTARPLPPQQRRRPRGSAESAALASGVKSSPLGLEKARAVTHKQSAWCAWARVGGGGAELLVLHQKMSPRDAEPRVPGPNPSHTTSFWALRLIFWRFQILQPTQKALLTHIFWQRTRTCFSINKKDVIIKSLRLLVRHSALTGKYRTCILHAREGEGVF